MLILHREAHIVEGLVGHIAHANSLFRTSILHGKLPVLRKIFASIFDIVGASLRRQTCRSNVVGELAEGSCLCDQNNSPKTI